MLEQSFGLFFFLKQTKNQNEDGLRYVYLRITVDGSSVELSTKQLWHPERWNANAGRASGTREDAKMEILMNVTTPFRRKLTTRFGAN